MPVKHTPLGVDFVAAEDPTQGRRGLSERRSTLTLVALTPALLHIGFGHHPRRTITTNYQGETTRMIGTTASVRRIWFILVVAAIVELLITPTFAQESRTSSGTTSEDWREADTRIFSRLRAEEKNVLAAYVR